MRHSHIATMEAVERHSTSLELIEENSDEGYFVYAATFHKIVPDELTKSSDVEFMKIAGLANEIFVIFKIYE